MSDRTARPKSIAIIGAGPAGLMAAEVAASAGHAVTVYERMPSPARKFLMAGRGGLNLTHSEPLELFLTRYGNDAKRVRDAVKAFPPDRVIAWAHDLGQETFLGSSGRIFPQAMKASPLLRAWLKRLDALRVDIKTQCTWTEFSGSRGVAIRNAAGVVSVCEPDAVIFALGGASWPRLGSDGAWVEAFAAAGISVAPLKASNAGARIAWSQRFATRYAGQPLKRIAISIGKTVRRGEAVITQSGLEGGVIYALGPDIRTVLGAKGSAQLVIDLKPDMTIEALTQRLLRPQGSQSRSNFLRKAAGLDAPAIGLIREAGPFPLEADATAALIKAVPVGVQDLAGLNRAISTAGGIRDADLTGDFMMSARPGVFVAGEMLDWDAPTGGYLLQGAFATGHAAAQGALNWLNTRPETPAVT